MQRKLLVALSLASYLSTSVYAATPCEQIEKAISSSSSVYYPGSANYTLDIAHWSAAAILPAVCSVEPGTAKDVGIILGILGATKTSFAVKGGGHSQNPGYSGTKGVQISMSRFTDVIYDASTQTAAVGTGNIWDDVYATLEPYGRQVVGGRFPGVGVAGFSLGGGYSWLSNQYGLSLDTIVGYELVKPDGTICKITQASDAELFFALKGAHHNFGIVTSIIFQTVEQGQIWGGQVIVAADQIPTLIAAAAQWVQDVTDPKAAILSALNGLVLLFYDEPTPPAGMFDTFLALPALVSDVTTRSYTGLVASYLAWGEPVFARVACNTVPIAVDSEAVMTATLNETTFWVEQLSAQIQGDLFFSWSIEPFLPTLLTHNSVATAYPFVRDVAFAPYMIQLAWSDPAFDDLIFDTMRQSVEQLVRVAVGDGQSRVAGAPPYPNYALFGTPVEELYGANLPKLKTIKARVDPTDVMGLAGGWRITL
ncbi:FAD dependent oxidoreductase [Hymenopellis radicata]|nr:FAD dependent oxidoreductase [Hymenopellis radicata]